MILPTGPNISEPPKPTIDISIHRSPVSSKPCVVSYLTCLFFLIAIYDQLYIIITKYYDKLKHFKKTY